MAYGSHKKKKLPNFGHCPNIRRGVSGAAKPFIEKRYGHVLRGEGGLRASYKVVFCKKSLFWGSLKSFSVLKLSTFNMLQNMNFNITLPTQALSEKIHFLIYQKLIL